MDRVDASVESMLKNLASLVRGSQFGEEADKPGAAPSRAGAPTDDHLLEVVASQLVGNCQDLFAVISSLRRAQESGNYARWLEGGLRLLHPFMPFLTEELWQRLPKNADYAKEFPSITIAPYPKCAEEFVDQSLVDTMAYSGVVVNKIRSLRATYGLVSNKQQPDVFLLCEPESKAKLDGLESYVATLSVSGSVRCVTDAKEIPEGCGVAPVDSGVVAYVVLTGLVDPEGEIKRLEKKLKECEAGRQKLEKRMSLPEYAKTPDKFKAEDNEKIANFKSEEANLAQAVDGFRAMLAKPKEQKQQQAEKGGKPEPKPSKEEAAPEPKAAESEEAPRPRAESSGFLKVGEKMVMKGDVKKKSTGFFSFTSQARTLVLTDAPRLLYMEGTETRGVWQSLVVHDEVGLGLRDQVGPEGEDHRDPGGQGVGRGDREALQALTPHGRVVVAFLLIFFVFSVFYPQIWARRRKKVNFEEK